MKIISLYSYDHCSNTFLVSSGDKCAIIDPGQPVEAIEIAIIKYNLQPTSVILTHGHFDHIYSLDAVREKYNIPAFIHEADAEQLSDSVKNVYSFFFDDYFTQKAAENTFKDGDKLYIGDEYLTVIHTPGHTKGASCFRTGNELITGDTLFAEGIGRTDMYGGDTKRLYLSLSSMRSITPANEIKIYPGHGRSEILSAALDNSIY